MTRRSLFAIPFACGALGALAAEKELSPEELSRLLEKRENLFFLDVREPEEIRKLGSIKGYYNIPLGQLQKRLSEVPKNKLIVTT